MQAQRLEDGAFLISCQMDSTPEDVRATLEGINTLLSEKGLAPTAESNWELVVAEVLNNIVEHAYEDRAGGEILLKLAFAKDRISVEFTDFGLPMPSGAAPAGQAADLDVAPEDMPEGGFGWFLIRSLSENLNYSNDGQSNRLTLSIPLS